MKIMLINTPTIEHPVIRDMAGGLGFDGGPSAKLPPLELAYMASTLMKNGNQVIIIDADIENMKQRDVMRALKANNPDIVIATVSLPSMDNDCQFIKSIKESSAARTVAKTAIPFPPIIEEILAKSSADVCIFGECDLRIHKILTGEETAGTARRINGTLSLEADQPIEDLDKLPLPARQLLPNDKYSYVLLGTKVTTMQTSRGCPFPCAYYCPYPLVQGRKWRSRSAGHVLREITDITTTFGIDKILFRDATFTFDKRRVHEICDGLMRMKTPLQWWCETRVDCLDHDLLRHMKEAGCRGLNVGVETGDPRVLETQAKIGMNLERLKTIRNYAEEIGLKLHFLLIVGLPKETRESIFLTYKMLLVLKPESIGVCLITPYPGTQLYQEAMANGWIETNEWSHYGGHYPVAHTPHLSREDLIQGARLLQRGFYFQRPRTMLDVLKKKYVDWAFKRWSRS